MKVDTSPLIRPSWRPDTHLVFWLLAGLHLTLALVLKFIFGVDIQAHPLVGDWDWFYHTVPTANLLAHPLSSIWYLHSQPPIFNLFGALVMRLFYPAHLQALQYIYMAMGALSLAMSYPITLAFTKSAKLSLVVALFLSLNPAFFLYEAYILYDILTVFEITTLVFLLCLAATLHNRRRNGYLVAFLVMATLLTLTRSLYHLVFLLPCIAIACLVAGKQWKQILVVGLCCSLLTLGWYVKNERQVGVFGGSSWLGIGLWKIAAVLYSDGELAQLAEAGVIEPAAAELPAFSRPSAYVRFGFDEISTNAEWRRDDFNNINIPAISKLYQENSLRLIAHDRASYWRMLLISYFVFAQPASKFADITHNTAKIAIYERVYADVLYMHYPFRLIKTVGSMLVVLLPLCLALYAVMLAREGGFSARRWATLLQREAALIFVAILLFYTVMVSTLLEFGENFRFKFALEIPLWIFIATILYRRYWRKQ